MSKPFFSVLSFSLIATLAMAQGPPPANVCEVHLNQVKPGMTAQYEQGRAKHMAWHKSQNDKWAWEVWEIVTGENTGDYMVVSCGHDWKDFDGRDKFNAEDTNNANATMGPYLARQTMSYYVLRPDLGAPPPTGQPPQYLNVIFFTLKPEGTPDFYEGVKKVGAAMSKPGVSAGPISWYSLASGGVGPQVVLIQERKSMAEMAGPGKTVDEIMRDAYGEQGATIMATLRKAYASTYSQLLHFRPELSYMPPASTR
jgi:hypothetical protein